MKTIIYSDMDGVLVDFEKQLEKTTKMSISKWAKLDRRKRWDPVIANKDFWPKMPWLAEGRKLWSYIRKYNTHILSAYVEHAHDPNCIPGKAFWAQRNLGLPRNKINLVIRSAKQNYAMSGGKPNILIDDYKKNTDQFTTRGGIGIHFTTASKTIAELKKHGF